MAKEQRKISRLKRQNEKNLQVLVAAVTKLTNIVKVRDGMLKKKDHEICGLKRQVRHWVRENEEMQQYFIDWINDVPENDSNSDPDIA